MTAATLPASAAGMRDARAGFGNVVRSEWTKLWSVRSTMWTLLALVVGTLGFSALFAWGASSHLSQMSPHDRATLDVTNIAMAGLSLGQLAIAVLGVLVVCSEYSSGGIRTTFTAVPARLRVLGAKAVVFGVVATVVGMVTAFGAFFVSMTFWSGKGLAASLGDPGVLRAVLGGGLFVLAAGMFGFALGTVIRHTAGAISAAVGLLFVAPGLTHLLPGAWGADVAKTFTTNAGQQITTVLPVVDQLSPWTGYAVFTLWWVIPLVIGAWLVKRRDA